MRPNGQNDAKRLEVSRSLTSNLLSLDFFPN